MARDSPVEDIRSYLNELGVYPKFEWLTECVGHLSNSDLTFSALPASAQAKLCFAQYINSDMNRCGAGILPENVASMHKQQLRGRFVLQVRHVCLHADVAYVWDGYGMGCIVVYRPMSDQDRKSSLQIHVDFYAFNGIRVYFSRLTRSLISEFLPRTVIYKPEVLGEDQGAA